MTKIDSTFFVPLLAAYAGASNADEFCKHLVHKVLRAYSPVGALIASVGNDSKCRAIGRFGAWELPPSGVFDLFDESPITEVLQNGTSISVSSKSELENKFPHFSLQLDGARSFTFSSFESTSRAVGFLALGFSSPAKALKPTDFELEATVIAAEHISISIRQFNMQISKRTQSATSNNSGDNQPHLTDRQLSILKHMTDGKTNYQIARLLNLSESSIKQESVRIFRELKVAGRVEASEFAKQTGLI